MNDKLNCTPMMRLIGQIFHACLLLVTLSIFTPDQTHSAERSEPDGKQHVSREELAVKLADETGIKAEEILTILKHATFEPKIIERMNRQWEAEPYLKYRPLFVKESLREKGIAYLNENRSIFSEVERKYRVDTVIIAAILGIETKFGRTHGSRPVLDSLYTLSTGFPRRADFFRSQLGAIIEISRQDHLDLKTLKGSYAGAFGAIQFIPTSFRDYAVDEDGDGVRNVFESRPDIIASVANYFHKHGWQYQRPSAFWLPAGSKLSNEWRERARGKLEHWVTLGQLRQEMPKLFQTIPLPWQDDDQVSIIELQTKHGRQFALVHFNFQVIMRYNSSYNYAMAVTEIAAMLERKTFAVD